MCQKKNKFIFCTCEGERKILNNSTELENYTWILTNYIGQKKSLIRGKIVLPKRDLGNGLTIEYIVNQLNNDNESFDFEYEPNEKDCLKISTSNINGETKYFTILYKNESWIEGSNPAFVTMSKIMATGKILKMND